jgi:hypothetical protein
MPAMGLVTLFVAAALVPASPYVVGLAALGASLTKETGYPFVAALGLVALLLARRRANIAIRRHVVFAGIGLALGLSFASAFNVLRFGTPRNAYYLDPALRTQSLHWIAELSAGLFVSPNGGIVLFWPLASLLTAVLVAIPFARALRHRTTWIDTWPALALAAMLLALTLGLASWWSPFGWWAWGPRLSPPWVPAIVLVALSAHGSGLTPVVARVLSRPPTALLVAGLRRSRPCRTSASSGIRRRSASSSLRLARPSAPEAGHRRPRRTTRVCARSCGSAVRSGSTRSRASGPRPESRPPPRWLPWSSAASPCSGGR